MTKKGRIQQKQLLSAPLLAIEQLGHQLGNSLILAPHPDDEALGCGGIISYLRSENVQVTVVFITSGNASHPNSLQYPSTSLATLRENEALDSCRILGVSSENVIFFKHPDGVSESFGNKEILDFAEKLGVLIEQRDITSMFLPWRRDVHRDHIGTNAVGFEAVKKYAGNIQVVEYPIWLWKNSKAEDWPFENEVEPFRLDVRDVLFQKKRAIFAHKSQTSDLITDDPSGFILTQDLLSPFLGIYEYFFFSKNHKINKLDQNYFDSLYSENYDPWNFENSDYELAKYIKTDEILGDSKFKKGLELGCSIGIQTRYLAKHCENLLAVDISKDAIETAKHNNRNLENVHFEAQDILKNFPVGPYDFIAMCELGYYFDELSLIQLFKSITENMNQNGRFLMVHWTSFVREYPLSGTQVNEIFAKMNLEEHLFSCVSSYTHERYVLKLWRKIN